MSRINSAQQPLFAIAAPIWQGLRGNVGGHLPKTELLRRAVPVFVAVFASLAAIGLVTQTLQSRQSAFDLAEERLALMADLTASRLKDEFSEARQQLARRACRKPAQRCNSRRAHRAPCR